MKISYLTRFFLILFFTLYQIIFFSCDTLYIKPFKVGFIVCGDSLSSEDKSVLNWLDTTKQFIPITLERSISVSNAPQADVFWLHLPDSVHSSALKESPIMNRVKEVLSNGGPVLFTGSAAQIPWLLGIETIPPEIRSVRVENDWMFDKRGFQSWQGHPVFNSFFGGAYTFDATEDVIVHVTGYFGKYPQQGRVIAVDRAFIKINAQNRIMCEYSDGKIITIGGYIYFNRPNYRSEHTKRFVTNCLEYLCKDKSAGEKTYWEYDSLRPSEFFIHSDLAPPFIKNLPANLTSTDLMITKKSGGDQFFDLAGRRILVMGKESGGIDEIWSHPFRIMRNYRAGIVTADSIQWLPNLHPLVEIRPESVKRVYKVNDLILQELIFTSPGQSGAVVRYLVEGSAPVKIIIVYECDHRLMWPYDENALGSLYYAGDSVDRAFIVRDKTEKYWMISGASIPPLEKVYGQSGDFQLDSGKIKLHAHDSSNSVMYAAVYELNLPNQNQMHMVFSGSNTGRESALYTYKSLMVDPLTVYNRNVQHNKKVLDEFVLFHTPDAEFNRLWQWALIGTDRFMIETPRVGTALVAGYGTTERGWDGGHKISGRPGYAWYFGRDASWSAFAMDDYGDFDSVRDQLIFFRQYQDITGKIFHEISTSGVVHYDAADATPLYVILAAHYLRASGDLEFIKKLWPSLLKAVNYLYKTDTDRDGLIENTNEGHGWVEGGQLWGAHTTLYLAGLWAQTLNDAAYIARQIGETEQASRFVSDGKNVKHILNERFWNHEEQYFYYGINKNGTFNDEKTILPAVPMYFRLFENDKVKTMLRYFAGNGFSSDWGVRILSSDSPLFNPRGYHYGSVWPLFTGWTALAEYKYGNSPQAFSHVMNNMYIKNHWAAGFVEEVMHGSEYRPSGVCAHQCWSETNIIHPLIAGMIGWKPFAPEKRIELRPQIPLHWPHVKAENLRIEDSKISFRMKRDKNNTQIILTKQEPGVYHIDLYPEIFTAQRIVNVEVNGINTGFDSTVTRGYMSNPVRFSLQDSVFVIINHTGGFGMLPVISSPDPDAQSEGFRYIGHEKEDETIKIMLEGRSGSSHIFSSMIFDRKIMKVEGAQLVSENPNGIIEYRVDFPLSKNKFSKKIVRLQLSL